ncbi:MAG: hypothetical protein H0T54_02440 [Geodermatophilaceae bacterium]|nr:hypothetical protein [Geodermatophilaceae bacterium]
MYLQRDSAAGVRFLAALKEATAFASWSDQLADRLRRAGMENQAAIDLASMLITILEGAHLLCRAAGNTQPFEQAARSLAALTATVQGR